VLIVIFLTVPDELEEGLCARRGEQMNREVWGMKSPKKKNIKQERVHPCFSNFRR